MSIHCNICGAETALLFKEKVLYKYDVNYFKCLSCGFVQTEKPFWLNEAYQSAINTSDIGLIQRNINFSNVIPAILDAFSSAVDSYLDYGGGYGMFVRMMRDKGYDFYLHDMYAENLFAKHFELKDYKNAGKFKAVTAFEVFEHLEDPVTEVTKMLTFSDIIIFSTELQPKSPLEKGSDWWYIGSNTGQHISFYTLDALQALANKLGLFVYSDASSLHIFSKEAFERNPFELSASSSSVLGKIVSKVFLKDEHAAHPVRTSLLQSDFELIKKQEATVGNAAEAKSRHQ